MHDAGILSPMEYASALRDIAASTGDARARTAGTLVIGKWATTLYGFMEGDAIYDTTQSIDGAERLPDLGRTARHCATRAADAGIPG
jgi:hypothetical protein